ncbi:MAG: nickel pincer cofactor biosynthesis protein LarB [Eubacteriaceae bacterium]|nr:nickel pincer cofactor biosynthesis protein LarB [Eubacteriaceae bacterium]
MEQQDIRNLLQQVKDGEVSTDEALTKLKLAPFEDIDIAKIDHHRGLRQGASEIIYGASKSPEQIDIIAHKMYESGQHTILITRMSQEAADYFNKDIPFAYYKEARIGLVGEMIKPRQKGYILVATGGTSDIPVAEEAALTAEILGNNVKRLYDVGVAGIHRLLAHTEDIMNARVIITIAGMEGALASVVGGLADCPMIAVPTSVGYGTALGGVTALLSMLNSCASGVSVVNIDNGFGAGYQAHLINNMEG